MSSETYQVAAAAAPGYLMVSAHFFLCPNHSNKAAPLCTPSIKPCAPPADKAVSVLSAKKKKLRKGALLNTLVNIQVAGGVLPKLEELLCFFFFCFNRGTKNGTADVSHKHYFVVFLWKVFSLFAKGPGKSGAVSHWLGGKKEKKKKKRFILYLIENFFLKKTIAQNISTEAFLKLLCVLCQFIHPPTCTPQTDA